jgi:hypothetical protein
VVDTHSPDRIAHLLVTNVGSPVRVVLEDGRATIPTEPCRGGSPATTTVSVTHVDALVERAAIEDRGLSLFCPDGLHLPPSEWRRVGLDRHWNADDADLRSPFFPPQRTLEVWASREPASRDATDRSHLDGLPDDSPVLAEWAATAPDDAPERPPVPFDRPTLYVRAVRAEGVTDVRGLDRVEVGRIARVEPLEALPEQPTRPDVEPRTVDPPSRSGRLDLEYEDLEPLEPSEDLLEAVFTINRHAKRLDDEADAAYSRGDGAEARGLAIQKRALYRSKTVALHRMGRADPDAIRVDRHELYGDHEMLCVSLRGYSFHQPLDAVATGLLRATIGHEDPSALPLEPIDFEASTDTDELDLSLTQAIAVLRDHGIDPNDYLEETAVEDFTLGYTISTRFPE